MKIIAEIGSNWRSEADCKESIAMAKAHGADAVKFQLFTSQELYGPAANVEGMKSLPREWVPRLALKAQQSGIEFMCTAFSPNGYSFLDPFVSAHKVASAEMLDVGILQRLRELGKPVYLSTGAHVFSEVAEAIKRLGDTPITLMHCVAAYPTREARLGRIGALRKAFGLPVGYSDHTTSIDVIPWTAAQMGAVVIEKHVTNYPGVATPDAGHSLSMSEFKQMVEYVRSGETIHPRLPGREESEMILRHNRRLKALKSIKVGEKLEFDVNFGSFRSLVDDPYSVSPIEAFDMMMQDGAIRRGAHGAIAKREIEAGDSIKPGDFR